MDDNLHLDAPEMDCQGKLVQLGTVCPADLEMYSRQPCILLGNRWAI